MRFSYKEFNEYDKLKFENDLIYFLVKLAEGLHELKLTVSLLSLYIYIYKYIELGYGALQSTRVLCALRCIINFK
jgi:hypothetical protein